MNDYFMTNTSLSTDSISYVCISVFYIAPFVKIAMNQSALSAERREMGQSTVSINYDIMILRLLLFLKEDIILSFLAREL